MAKSKTKSCYPRYSKDGSTIISYRFFYSGKDPYTGKAKQFTKTWKVPQGLTRKEIEIERETQFIEFRKDCLKELDGSFVKESYLTFGEYSQQWLDRLLKVNPDSYSYYAQAKNALKVINPYFGECLLTKITPLMVQRFYDYLCDRTYIKTTVTVKQSIEDLLKGNKVNKVANECGIDRHTLSLSTKVGQPISLQSARTISKCFNIPLSKYFDIQEQKVKYSKATNSGIRTILVIILGEAKRQRLIEHNFASKEYTKPIKGTVKEKEIFDEQEVKSFVQAVLKEPCIRKKTVFALLIFLGLRKAEVCGLSWNDINLTERTLSVNHNVIYQPEFGIVVKNPKTQKSKRTIRIPNQLAIILEEYKLWYDTQKINYGHLWANTNYLFLQDSGNIINPSTVYNWLKDFNLKNGFKPIPPHSLRHTCITMQINAGVSLKVVSARAGHSNEQITLGIYTHTLKQQDEKAADIYNDYLMSAQ